jgi:hypothetical protein
LLQLWPGKGAPCKWRYSKALLVAVPCSNAKLVRCFAGARRGVKRKKEEERKRRKKKRKGKKKGKGKKERKK